MALIRAVERMAPSLILLTTIVGAIGTAWLTGSLVMRYSEQAREALRDGIVRRSEAVVLASQGVALLAIGIPLAWFAWFLMGAAASGLRELMGG